MVLDAVGLAVAVVDAAVQLLLYLKGSYEARKEHTGNIVSLYDRVVRIQNNIHNYKDNSAPRSIPGKVFQRVADDFDKVNGKLQELKVKLSAEPNAAVLSISRNSAADVTSISLLLATLEDHLDLYGLVSDFKSPLQIDFTAVTEAITIVTTKQAEEVEKNRKEQGEQLENNRKDESQAILSELSELKALLSTQSCPKYPRSRAAGSASKQMESLEHCEEPHVSLAEIRAGILSLPIKLSNCGVSEEIRQGLIRDIIDACGGWKICDDDVIFDRQKNGRNIILGVGNSGDVYKARLMRKDDVPLRVAVKQLKVPKYDLGTVKTEVLLEMFLQMDCKHDCILNICGAHWPESNRGDSNLYYAPYIVMERMTCNLRTACREGLMSTYEVQTRVLLDVARALLYLHGRRIVHRDVKPENVLVRVVDGELVGNAKLSDFGTSRRFSKNGKGTAFVAIKDAPGTLSVMPPEVLSDIDNCRLKSSWDVWSFGLLICYMSSTDDDSFPVLHAKNAHNMLESGNLKKFADNFVPQIPDRRLQEIARACLRRNADQRPDMTAIVQVLSAKCWNPDDMELLGPSEALVSNLPKNPCVQTLREMNEIRNADLGERRHCIEPSQMANLWRRVKRRMEPPVTLVSGLRGIFHNFALQAPKASTLPIALYCFTCGAPAQVLNHGLQEIVLIGEHPVLSTIRCTGCNDPCWFVDRENPYIYVS